VGWGGRSSGSRRRSFSCTLVAALRASAAIARLPIPQRARSERESDPARGCRTAIVRAGAEGDGGLGRCLAGDVYDCVVIGAGVRLPPSRLVLFEAVVNAVHRTAFNC